MLKPLALLFNKSFTSGVFPDSLKIGKVVPVYKKGNKHDIRNYRPISILPVLSKVFEKIVYNRLISFINKYNILSESQYGFRAQRSTELAITSVLNKIMNAIENKQISIGIFLDLSKAFDTVNHNILITKLEHIGVRGLALDWFRSYLADRKQFVSFNSSCSPHNPISCGVPQGSVLGPLLFIIYVNDICNTSDIISFCLFADDTSLLYNHHNVDIAIKNLNIELIKITDWLLSNKLSINVLKTNYVIFSSRQNRYYNNGNIYINGTALNQAESIKFLGTYINENLSWSKHINVLVSKISKNVGVMNRLKPVLPKNILLTLYNSLILPYLNYAILNWGNSTASQCNQILLVQKKAVRIICKTNYREHTDPLFAELKVLKFNDLYNLNLGKFMFKYKSGQLPSKFNDLFISCSSVHTHGTRSASRGDFYTIYNRTSLSKNSLISRCVFFWNNLNLNIKQSLTLKSFSKNLKYYLLSMYY